MGGKFEMAGFLLRLLLSDIDESVKGKCDAVNYGYG